MTPPEPSESRRLTALTELLRGAVKVSSSAELQDGLSALRARQDSQATRRRRGRWALLAAAVFSCGVMAVILPAALTERAEPTSVVAVEAIHGGKLLEGGYLSELGNSGIELSFNEGSKFVLLPGTRGRLRGVTADGARLAIEHGSASFRITESRGHKWSVEAGPFLVTVRGTEFSVFWEPGREQFEVRLRRGRVSVSGPVVGEDLALRPGQKLMVSLQRAELTITEDRPGAGTNPDAPRATPSVAPRPSSGAMGAPLAEASNPIAASASSRANAPSARRWREAMANGQWDQILAEVDRDGLGTALQTLSSDELFALADAARYRRRVDLARAALIEQRRRFPGSPRSLDALFLLARVEESGADGKRRAIARYDEYLARAPSGTYASEALGRRMVLTKDVEGPASAARIAESYLRRFPQGSYSSAARALQRTP